MKFNVPYMDICLRIYVYGYMYSFHFINNSNETTTTKQSNSNLLFKGISTFVGYLIPKPFS